MSSLRIDAQRARYPGMSDAEIAMTLAQEYGYIVVVRYKNSPQADDFTDFGTCQSEEKVHEYFRSSYCHDVEIVYDGRVGALRITAELILAGRCETCGKATTNESLTSMAGNDFYICPKCAAMFCDTCYTRLPISGGRSGYGMCPRCRVEVQRAIADFYGKQFGAPTSQPAKRNGSYTSPNPQSSKKWWQLWK